MILGLVSCSMLKLPVPAPAWLLYSRSPRFSQAFQYTRSRSDQTFILSAKFWMLDPLRVIHPYNKSLEDLTEIERGEWKNMVAEQIAQLKPKKIILTASGMYARLIKAPKGVKVEVLSGGVFERAKALGKQGRLLRGTQVKVCWPMEWILTYVFQNGPLPLINLKHEIERLYLHPGTREAQLYRSVKCPLHIVENGRIRNRYK